MCLGWVCCLIPLQLLRWLQVLCLPPALLSPELVPGAGSGGADVAMHRYLPHWFRSQSSSSLLKQESGPVLFVPLVLQYLAWCLTVGRPSCLILVICVYLFIYSYHGELDHLSVNHHHSSLLGFALLEVSLLAIP